MAFERAESRVREVRVLYVVCVCASAYPCVTVGNFRERARVQIYATSVPVGRVSARINKECYVCFELKSLVR